MRILRGGALAANGDSYLDRAQRVAELESQLKMQRFIRDMPKYERRDSINQEWLRTNQLDNRDSIEDSFTKANPRSAAQTPDYTPVLYQVVKDKAALDARQSLSQI